VLDSRGSASVSSRAIATSPAWSRVQGHYAAIGEEAAEGGQSDLIIRAQRSYQTFHAHQIADHPVGIGITFQLVWGAAP